MPRREHQLGPADYAILGLLAVGPRHGYELAPYFAPVGELGLVCTLGLPQLYALLHALEHMGHVHSEQTRDSAGPPRKVFHLTETGLAMLENWLRRPVRRAQDVRQEFLLKLFFVRRLPDRSPLDLVKRQLDASSELLQELQQAGAQADAQSFPALVYASRLRLVEATMAWLKEYHDQLAPKPVRRAARARGAPPAQLLND